jgi:peptide/nickel transport system permease protein
VFLLLRLTPGDPAAIIAGDNANTEQIEQIRKALGLDEPIVAQFAIWLKEITRGNLGESFFFKRTVVELIAQRLEPTLALATCTITLAVLIAVPLGVLAAWRQGRGWTARSWCFRPSAFPCPFLSWAIFSSTFFR